ncbi:MAG: hypothetical protein M3R12_02920 [Actinomycetota bacterium]|nr:hypothetical protein [Actinomycetota bacterium]
MKVEELAPGLWRWSAARDGEETWCVYYEAPGTTVLIDPVVPDEREQFFRALDRDIERRGAPVTILCTSADRESEAGELVERYGANLLRA